jgi:AdoMet-dependent heme synthase
MLMIELVAELPYSDCMQAISQGTKQRPAHVGRGMRFQVDFEQAPLLLIWEVTRSCELACQHCRAEAIHQRHPGELSLDEGRRLIDDVAAMGTPLIIFTGGDPLQRDDLEDLIAHAKAAGLRAGTIPATTYRLTRERLVSLQQAGVDQLALSLDGETAAKHDAFRGVEGSFDKVMQGAAWIRELGVPLQINTVFGAWNVDDFDALAALVESLGVVFWEVFFLVPTGRGTALRSCTAEQFERLFAELQALSQRVDYVVKITEGQHYRRYLAEQHAGERQPMMPAVAVNAGRGFCFVDHTGTISPSGFLPLDCGNVRKDGLAQVYRRHPVFTALRDPEKLEGKCGRCRHRTVCGGGSRARAYGLTGNLHAPEPFCRYGG